MQSSANIGLVLIGRNEGERLRRCLMSVMNQVSHIVYVDSDSSDGSVDLAKSFGVDVVELDRSQPFASPRSRNAGFEYLLQKQPNLKYVQFLDGDCELVDGWLERAISVLDTSSELAIVCGRRRELFPQKSVYNKLCDIEWNTPVGEAKYCGGDFMVRPQAFQQVGGFNPTLIGGGEPEMCVRLRRAGWKINRLDAAMSIHDADIQKFSQWWNRSRRCGHAYAEGSWMHGLSREKHWLKEALSNWAWGFLVPLMSLVLAWPTHGISMLILLLYPILLVRTFFRTKSTRQLSVQDAWIYSLFCLLIKFPMVVGQMLFLFNKAKRKKTKLVEYKTVTVIEPQ